MPLPIAICIISRDLKEIAPTVGSGVKINFCPFTSLPATISTTTCNLALGVVVPMPTSPPLSTRIRSAPAGAKIIGFPSIQSLVAAPGRRV